MPRGITTPTLKVPFPSSQLIDDARGEMFPLTELATIGRSQESSVSLSDPRVSRRHAVIRQQDQGFWFFDLGSSNGSSINGRRVTTAQKLESGDLVRIGDHQLRFDCSSPSEEASMERLSCQTLLETRSTDALIFVCDIQGFTSLSEKLEADQLAPIIGSWYSKMGIMLEEHGATLDKFIGDCALAYWLDTSASARESALRAVTATQRTAEEVQSAHKEVLAKAGVTFRTGVAVHRGTVAYGAISAGEFTLLGDAVNIVFRLEALTRKLDKPALISGDFFSGWEQGKIYCNPHGSHHIKGRSKPVEIFCLERAPD